MAAITIASKFRSSEIVGQNEDYIGSGWDWFLITKRNKRTKANNGTESAKKYCLCFHGIIVLKISHTRYQAGNVVCTLPNDLPRNSHKTNRQEAKNGRKQSGVTITTWRPWRSVCVGRST